MKVLLICILALGSISTSHLAHASCARSYQKKSEGMLPKNISKKKAGKIGAGALIAGAVLGAGPITLVGGASGGKAYLDKVSRLKFFNELILAANQSAPAPVSKTGFGFIVDETRFERLVRTVNRLSDKSVSEADILQAIARADAKDEFCLKESNEEDLKTSIKAFAKVIVKNL